MEAAAWLLASVGEGPAQGRAAVLGLDAEWVPRARAGWIPRGREGEVRSCQTRPFFDM